MTHSYVAYIDECGDDGLGNYRTPGGAGGGSHWLTISATVTRMSRDLEVVKWRDDIRNQMRGRERRPLHFKDLNHGQRTMAARELGAKPIRAICIIANKPTTPAGIYVEKNQLYFYLSRYLMERLSWLCRDMRPTVPEGDGRVKIVFSRRGGLSYEGFRDYLQRLKAQEDKDVRIHWPVIDIDGIEALDHSKRAGLQLADLVASSMTAALEPDFYGNCELKYAEALKPVVYHRGGNYKSYGLKLYPNADKLGLDDQQQKLCNLFGM